MQTFGEMLGQAMVTLRGGAAEVIEGQPEAVGQRLLHDPHLGAVVSNRFASLGGGQQASNDSHLNLGRS